MVSSHLKYNLDRSYSETVGVDGSAIQYVGPSRVGERWRVIRMSTSIDADDAQFNPRMHVYKNGYDLVAGTYNANDDTSGGDDVQLRNGETLKFVLSGAQPGKRWTVSVGGEGYAV